MVQCRARDVAQVFGVSERRIAQFVIEGMPKGGRGNYNIPECHKWYNARYGGQLKDRTLDEQRQELIKEQTLKTKLENDTKQSELLPIDEVTAVVAATITMLSGILDAFSRRNAIVLAGLTDENEVERVLWDETRAVRSQFAGQLAALGDHIGNSSKDNNPPTEKKRRRVGRPGKDSTTGKPGTGALAK